MRHGLHLQELGVSSELCHQCKINEKREAQTLEGHRDPYGRASCSQVSVEMDSVQCQLNIRSVDLGAWASR